MKYMLLIIGQPDDATAEPPTAEAFQEYQKAAADAGIVVDGNPLDDVALATSVRVRGGILAQATKRNPHLRRKLGKRTGSPELR